MRLIIDKTNSKLRNSKEDLMINLPFEMCTLSFGENGALYLSVMGNPDKIQLYSYIDKNMAMKEYESIMQAYEQEEPSYTIKLK